MSLDTSIHVTSLEPVSLRSTPDFVTWCFIIKMLVGASISFYFLRAPCPIGLVLELIMFNNTRPTLHSYAFQSSSLYSCIRARKQRTDIGKYSLASRTIKHWNQLPAEALVTFLCKSHIFRKGVRRVIISEERWRDLKRGDETSKGGGKWEMGSAVNDLFW